MGYKRSTLSDSLWIVQWLGWTTQSKNAIISTKIKFQPRFSGEKLYIFFSLSLIFRFNDADVMGTIKMFDFTSNHIAIILGLVNAYLQAQLIIVTWNKCSEDCKLGCQAHMICLNQKSNSSGTSSGQTRAWISKPEWISEWARALTSNNPIRPGYLS